ncbi:MAG: DUF4097 domain-containing protein [Clostridiales bacterium]|nr:DUF4097 domain-containing protein [Clostridiales bacterium]
MKRTSKILAVGATVLIIGVIVWVIGMSIIGWNFSRLDNAKYTARSYACEDDVKSISISLSSFPLTVKQGERVSLDYYEVDNSEVFVEEKDGVLSVVENYKYRPFSGGLFNIGRRSHKFTLTVVSGAKLEIKGNNSDISIEDIDFEEFSMNSTNAAIRFTRVQFGKLNIKATNCDIKLNGCQAPDATIKATNLDVTVKNCEFDSVGIDGTNVDCELERVKLDTLSLDAVNLDADIEIVGNASEYTVKASGRGLPANRTGTTDKLIKLSGTNNDVTLKFV